MAISVLDRLIEAQKLNPAGTSTTPPTSRRKYFPLNNSRLSASSGFGITKTPDKYVGKPSAFIK